MGSQPLAQRLSDKSYSWSDLQRLIPGTIALQLFGYTFTCTDMIGGGQASSFNKNKSESKAFYSFGTMPCALAYDAVLCCLAADIG